MSSPGSTPASRVPHAIRTLLGSAATAQALAVCIIGTAFSVPLLRNLIGWPGVISVVGTLSVIAAIVLIARREMIDWHGLLPLSIIAFVAWCGFSAFWSEYTLFSIQGSAYQVAFAGLGMTVALTRDMIQIVRAVGGVLRALLTFSLALEMLSGIFFDTPFEFLGIEGNIAAGGPIQGIFVTRNFLGLVTIIALITFVIEWRTRSVDRRVAIYSISIAALCMLLSGSPINILLILVLLLATLALYWLRKSRPAMRRYIQAALLVAAMAAVTTLYIARERVVDVLNAGSEFEVRYRLWRAAWDLVQVHPLEGWGWVGAWQGTVSPFAGINLRSGRHHSSALNAYLDVYLQVGLVGIFAFLLLCVFAFLRSWVLASNRKSVVYAWPALVLVALLAVSTAESFVLTDIGWVLLVICAAKGSQNMSWRGKLREKDEPIEPVPAFHPDTLD